jgi:hypothetical protein
VQHKQQRQHTPASSPFSYTQSGTMQSSLAPHGNAPARKKRKISNPSLPAEFFNERRPSSAQTPVQGWQNQANGLPYPTNSTPAYSIDGACQSQQIASGPVSSTPGISYSVTDADQPADFSTLTSKFSPVDEITGRSNPESLAYYALAAGQQRGGILAYQPVGQHAPGFTPAIAYDQGSAGGNAALYLQEQPSRQIASLPHQIYQYANQGVLQPPISTASVYSVDNSNPYSLSPAIARSSSYVGDLHSQGIVAPPQGELSLPPPAMHYQEVSRQNAIPASIQGQEQAYRHEYPNEPINAYSQAYANPSYYVGEYDQNYQNTAPAPPAAQNMAPPTATAAHAYYSSFSNNGLPGVLQWPTKYAAVVGNASHTQGSSTAWSRQPGYLH